MHADKVPTAARTPREDIHFIQALRGLAALIVVWAHLGGYWIMLTSQPTLAQDLWHTFVVVPLHVFENGGHFGVVVFFLISGFIITHASLRETRRDFAIKRAFRILPALWVAVVLTYVLVRASSALGELVPGFAPGPWWRWGLAMFLGDAFTPGVQLLSTTWTLVIEMLFYLAVFALIPLQRTRPLLSTWVMLAVWVPVTIGFQNLSFLDGTQAQQSPVYVGFLILGRAIYLGSRGLTPVFDAVLLGSSAFGLYLLLTEAFNPGFLLTPGGWGGVEPLVTYIAAILVLLVASRMTITRLPRPLDFLGDISYSLYLLHLPVGFATLLLLDQTSVPKSLNTFIAIGVVLAASALSYRLVEKPAQRLARRVTRRPATSTDTIPAPAPALAPINPASP